MISRQRKWDIFYCILFWSAVALVGHWALDRKPPYKMLSYEVLGDGLPGTLLPVSAVVKRDIKRGCSAEFTRYFYDSRGFRYDYGPAQIMTALAIEDMEQRQPGRLHLLIPVPDRIAPGPARYVTVLEYSCNPIHKFWPIQQTVEIPFTVTKP